MKVGDLVYYNAQPMWSDCTKDEYGIGLILEEVSDGVDNGSVFTVWWSEYTHGPVHFDHEEIDLVPL